MVLLMITLQTSDPNLHGSAANLTGPDWAKGLEEMSCIATDTSLGSNL